MDISRNLHKRALLVHHRITPFHHLNLSTPDLETTTLSYLPLAHHRYLSHLQLHPEINPDRTSHRNSLPITLKCLPTLNAGFYLRLDQRSLHSPGELHQGTFSILDWLQGPMLENLVDLIYTWEHPMVIR